jgi:hypothetical protein
VNERVTKWQPITGIDSSFGSISYSFDHDVACVRMHGARTLVLRFSGVVALRFEQECPGIDFPAVGLLPMLRPAQTFPLLFVEGSRWHEEFSLVYKDILHFALVSSDHLLQVLARAEVGARWDADTSNPALHRTATGHAL